jgi:hypothetical protein
MRHLSAFTCLIAACAMSLAARAEECATAVLPEEVPVVLESQAVGLYQLGVPAAGLYYVPLAFHVVQRDDGSEGIQPERLEQALIDANAAFLPMGIQFCVVLNAPIRNSLWNPLRDSGQVDILRQTDVVPAAVNIYFTETTLFCGLSSFTFSRVQGIIMHNDCTGVSWNHSTFPHEIGHYFDLFHTHETAFGRECTSGSNCDVAGDLLCDTPADPRLSSENVDGNCQYIGGGNGPCEGDPPYDPDTRNYLSYSRTWCRDRFSDGQHERGLATLLNLRPELALPDCPKLCPGDVNFDDRVDQADLAILLGSYGLASRDAGYNPMADHSGNGRVDQADLAILLAAFNTECR